jgi:ketosteroid isomerase-like protein
MQTPQSIRRTQSSVCGAHQVSGRQPCGRACRLLGASAIHTGRMNDLTIDAVEEIEQIHTNWIEFEHIGDHHSLMALCADDIELWPPDAPPLLGRAAVLAQLVRGTTKVHSVEITDRRIRGSNEIAYLTACYKTTFSSAEDSASGVFGSHMWILRKRAGTWVVTLVTWSLWGHAG